MGSGLPGLWQQEFGIAAALSRDPNMMAAYASGDPYLAFAKQCGAAPADATKQSHKAVREQFKACVLACSTAWKRSRSPCGLTSP